MAIAAKEGDVVTFQLVVANVIPNAFTNVTVLGVMSYDGATFIDNELRSKHTNMYPYFKDKVANVDNPKNYSYLIVKLPSGKTMAIGLPWIVEGSYKEVGDKTASIIITGFQEKYRDPILDLLGNLGATFTIDVK